MASILKVDDLRGNTAAGNITITSEGGSATMQLQQGVAKVLGQKNQAGTSIVATLNVSSLDDDGTGDFGVNYTNSFSSTNYIVSLDIPSSPGAGNSFGFHCALHTKATGSGELATWYGDASTNATLIDWPTDLAIFGDLA